MTEVREPMVAYGKKTFTIEEYLDYENASPGKHEYYQGEIFAMAGAGLRHNLLFSNLFTEIGIRLKGKKCKPYGSDMRTHIPENGLFTYPISVSYAAILSIPHGIKTVIPGRQLL
jgi:Uma2 family endonuclease